ncbi:MAG: hypothetical protein HFH84_07380 [Lachnospiraceae bacterium]|jgi:hypothetical protein|nr:hypothetical protein [Lachnospiraceae bacterium]
MGGLKMNMLSKRRQTQLYLFLIILSVLASFKMIFFAVGLDEEYQLVMAYRNVRGDRLFLDMWEPHQSSAFLCALLMKPWLALFGTTGVVLYLRICGTLLHLGISLYLYKVLKAAAMDTAYARLLALIYYNTIPKQIILPEFGIMQVWCYTLMALFLVRYYTVSTAAHTIQWPSGRFRSGAGSHYTRYTATHTVRWPSGRFRPGAGSHYAGGRKRKYLVLAAFSLALNVLSYPSCLILFPFLLILLARFSGCGKWRDMGIVTLVCVLCGLGYLGMLFTYTTPAELPETLSHILEGDVTHSLTIGKKLLSLLTNALVMAALWALCLALSLVIAYRKKLNRGQTCCLTAVFACIAELFYWAVLGAGYETMHIHLVAFALAGLCVYGRDTASPSAADACSTSSQDSFSAADACSASSQDSFSAADACSASSQDSFLTGIFGTEDHGVPLSAEACGTISPAEITALIPGNDTSGKESAQKSFLRFIMAGSVLSLLAVTYLTDLSFAESIPHAMPAAFCGAILLILSLKKEAGTKETLTKESLMKESLTKESLKKVNNGTSDRWIYATLAVWCLTAVFGKGYTLRSGTGYNNVLQSGGILREGPAAGTISNYIGAYIYNCDHEDWQSYVQDGDRVLIMVDQVMNLGTIQYLFKDVEISHFSIVNPTAYDERLLEYWELYPEKYPNVIIVDCWYGQLMTDPEGWLMQYIENDFGYTQVNDGRYIRIYRR